MRIIPSSGADQVSLHNCANSKSTRLVRVHFVVSAMQRQLALALLQAGPQTKTSTCARGTVCTAAILFLEI